MKVIGVIPARYASSRFPGKPLADIHGKPMIWHVYKQAKKVQEFDKVYVATDDGRIFDVCRQDDMACIMTSDKHPTGTDRVAEVAKQVKADIYINIQGDEPMIEPETISAAITPFSSSDDIQVTNLMSRIDDPVDAINPTVPKVVASDGGRGIYLSRSMTPFPKGSIGYSYYKQVGIYGYTSWALEFFAGTPRGSIEKIEDIEVLRFIENGIYVKYVEVSSASIAVDTEKDLEKVRSVLIRTEQ